MNNNPLFDLVECLNCESEFYKASIEIKRYPNNYCCNKCVSGYKKKKSIAAFYNGLLVNGECHEWQRKRNKSNYGLFKYENQWSLAHRVSYILSRGDIPEGLFVCHSCDNPPCVNPDHLWLGTHQDNMDDMVKKGRSKRKTPSPPITEKDNARSII